jgi:hypothetical protein
MNAIQRWLRVPVIAGMVLLVAYVALSFTCDPEGFLGTDTGGKVATVKVMSERGDFDPDLGHWAGEWDPEARVHGLYYTSRIGDRFINVTSLPMVLAARPLWDLGGYRATLLLPMAGAIAAAFAARALSRRLGDGDGWAAFWVIGLASPLVVYALDLWEHTLGAGLMAWGTVALVDCVLDRATWWRGLLAGAAFGAAGAMRTEAFVYVLATVGVTCAVIAFGARREIGRAVMVGVSAVAGFAAAFGANLALEAAVLGEPMRSGRASGAASSGADELGLRIKEGLITSLSPFPTLHAEGWLVGAGLLLALGLVAARSARRDSQPIVVGAAAVAGLIYLWRFSNGLGFVPGLVAATPFAAAGVALAWHDRRSRLVAALALVPLPLVFAFQYTGGAAPQWAGRYILFTGLLLAVVGVSERRRMAQWAQVGFVVLSVAVTVFGVAWLATRSAQIADAADRLQQRDEQVLITPNGFISREFGATYGDADWLAAGSSADLAFAFEVAGESGASTVALVDLDTEGEPPEFPGWTAGESELVPFLDDVDFLVTTYQRDGT